MKKRLFYLPLLLLILCACKNPAGPSTGLEAKVFFDPEKMDCRNMTTAQDLLPGAVVRERDYLWFYAKLSGSQQIDAWYLNDVNKNKPEGSWFNFAVWAATVVEENGEKVIKVRYTLK
ncbi:hypothetical protein V1L52_10415 [Treponema sp. HNW]|uniref:hypothetical protein n=1 Tax=Treponema sp. HNW TaxID=3116654 RepID=UPI003D111706